MAATVDEGCTITNRGKFTHIPSRKTTTGLGAVSGIKLMPLESLTLLGLYSTFKGSEYNAFYRDAFRSTTRNRMKLENKLV